MFDLTSAESYLLCSADAAVRRRAALYAVRTGAAAGRSVFTSDPTGRLSGIAKVQGAPDGVTAPMTGAPEDTPDVTFWDVYASRGLALRTTVSELGPYLMGMLLELTDAQNELLTVLYQIADDAGLLLIDTKDLKALINEVTQNRSSYEKNYGAIHTQSASAILKALTLLEQKGAKDFLFEPAIDVRDLTDRIHILDAQDLSADEVLYRVMILYLLSECAEQSDVSGMVLIIDDAANVLGIEDEAFVRKIRSLLSRLEEKEIQVVFLSEKESDVPVKIRERLSVGSAAEWAEGTEDIKGITLAARKEILAEDPFAEKYKVPFERDSAYEFLLRRGMADAAAESQAEIAEEAEAGTADVGTAADAAESPAAETARTDAEAGNTLADAGSSENAAKADAASEGDAASEAKEISDEAAAMAKRAKSSAQSLGNTVAGTVGRQIGKSIGENFGSFGSTLGGNIGASLGRGIMKTFFGD